ncbi:uncharacterized protein LOC101861673 [Aplysia californica]|uniref:Uncharacterized protein LOC101861673 n=1 Tax=Aplysia californica TaxID=6500 RepID=A0ABM0JXE6_APLCA|nr:uncharacterized protein LOC101861673 [Aplysia californica]
MNKGFGFKRNRSHDAWNQLQPSPTMRRKSLPRDVEYGTFRPTYKSEFPLNDSLLQGIGQDTLSFSPSLRRLTPTSYEAVRATTSPGKKGTRAPYRHRDLRRKFEFILHSEIQKSVHTTPLEEISDIDRITAICESTLSSMMQNKVHRQYLHHMNNNNSTCQLRYPQTSPPYAHDQTNSSSAPGPSSRNSQKTQESVSRSSTSNWRKTGTARRDSGRPSTFAMPLPVLRENKKRKSPHSERTRAEQALGMSKFLIVSHGEQKSARVQPV